MKHLLNLSVAAFLTCGGLGCGSGDPEGFSDTFRSDDTVESSIFSHADDEDHVYVEGNFFLTVVSSGVSSAEVILNGSDIASPNDFHNDSFERTTEVQLEEENAIEVEVRGSPGDQLCVRVFEVLPPEEVEEGESDERTIYERCVDREAGPPNSISVTFGPTDE